MRLTSPSFEYGRMMPRRHTCDGDDLSPALHITGIPAEAVALTLVVEDPDAPRGTWHHWVAFDIPPIAEIPEDVGPLGTSGENSWGTTGYRGPCPGSGIHRYLFRALALSRLLGLPERASARAVEQAAAGKVLAEATLMGRYGL